MLEIVMMTYVCKQARNIKILKTLALIIDTLCYIILKWNISLKKTAICKIKDFHLWSLISFPVLWWRSTFGSSVTFYHRLSIGSVGTIHDVFIVIICYRQKWEEAAPGLEKLFRNRRMQLIEGCYSALLWQKEASDIPSKFELLMFS